MSKGIWTKHFSVEGKTYYYNAAQNRSLWTPPPDSVVHEAINIRPPTYVELAGATSSYGRTPEIMTDIDTSQKQHGFSGAEYQNNQVSSHTQGYQRQQFPERPAIGQFDSSGRHTEYQQHHQQYQQDESNLYQVPHENYRQGNDNYFNPPVAPTLLDHPNSSFHDHNIGDNRMYQDRYQGHNSYQDVQESSQYQGNDSDRQPFQQQQQRQQQNSTPLVSAEELMTFATSTKQKQQNSKRFRAQAPSESDSNGKAASSYLQQKSEFEARAGNRDEESGKWLVR